MVVPRRTLAYVFSSSRWSFFTGTKHPRTMSTLPLSSLALSSSLRSRRFQPFYRLSYPSLQPLLISSFFSSSSFSSSCGRCRHPPSSPPRSSSPSVSSSFSLHSANLTQHSSSSLPRIRKGLLSSLLSSLFYHYPLVSFPPSWSSPNFLLFLGKGMSPSSSPLSSGSVTPDRNKIIFTRLPLRSIASSFSNRRISFSPSSSLSPIIPTLSPCFSSSSLSSSPSGFTINYSFISPRTVHQRYFSTSSTSSASPSTNSSSSSSPPSPMASASSASASSSSIPSPPSSPSPSPSPSPPSSPSSSPDIPDRYFTVPNLMTMIRMGLAPYVGYCILTNDYSLAFYTAFFAGILDGLDGWVARTWSNQASVIGSYLDPLADKLLIISATITLGYQYILSPYLVTLIIGRDILLIIGGLVLRYRTKPSHVSFFSTSHASTLAVEPTTLSKYNTLLQIMLICLSITSAAWEFPGKTDHWLLQGLSIIVAITTFFSGYGYWQRHGYRTIVTTPSPSTLSSKITKGGTTHTTGKTE